MTDRPKSLTCGSCGHSHTGSLWGHICIGCPCEKRPGAPEAQALSEGARIGTPDAPPPVEPSA